ncbi:hypothetical protein NOCA2460010 [metagenome]|uniref:RNA polymerase sigma-70 region 2 domain-containing protein n=1 Tax=metagenome TaxID=256318 RepID=A0A2P2C766_9ZZZZ
MGDPPEFDEWVAARGGSLLRLAYLLTGDAEDAEDLVQDALSRALPRWARISTVEDPDAYLRRWVVDAHTSWWRRLRRRKSPDPLHTAVVLRHVEDLDHPAIAELTESAPAPVRLAEGARRRLARRRRATVTAMSLAAVLVAVPAALVALAGADDRPAPLPPRPTTEQLPEGLDVLPGWHTESWRDVEIQVPDSWAYGALAVHCGGRGQGTPVVERPSGRMPLVACSPAQGYGVQFVAAGDLDPGEQPGVVSRYASGDGVARYPDGAWVGVGAPGGEAALRVVARSERVAEQVLASAHRIGDLDGNGCEPTADLAVTDGVPVIGGIVTVSAVAVCGYDVLAGPATEEPLAWSARLTGDAAQGLLDSLQSAAVHGNASARRCLSDPFGPAYLVRIGSARVWVRPVGSCPPNGAVVDGGQTRLLTPEVLSQVAGLTPGSRTR